MSTDFHNRFPSLRKWEDRISDSCIFDDWYPGADPLEVPKYDIFLVNGWSFEDTTDPRDCQSTEHFFTMREAKQGLAHAVHMPTKHPEVCAACQHWRDGACHA